MNTTILIITLAIIIAVVGPMIAYNSHIKSKKRKRVQNFLSLAESHQLQLDEYDLSLHAAIGIDLKSRRLIYAHVKTAASGKLVIDLSNYRHCEAAEITRNMGTAKDPTTIIDRVELVLRPAEKSDKEIKLEFFNSDHDSHITDEFDLVSKWAGIINQCIKKN